MFVFLHRRLIPRCSPFSDLPGMPIEVPDAASCQAQCTASSNCSAYVVLHSQHFKQLCPPVEFFPIDYAGPISRLRRPELLLAEGRQCSAAERVNRMQLLCKQALQIQCGHHRYEMTFLSLPFTFTMLSAGYLSYMNHSSQHPRTFHATSALVIGVTSLMRYNVPLSEVNLGERKAFVDCVSALLLDGSARENSTVKINVAWDENDYQIDVATPAGVQEYRRIIDRNSELGVTHVVYGPGNTLHSTRHNSTGWGWEGILWLSMGEKLRQGSWSPSTDAVPADILEMVAYAKSRGVSLVAYVYPCLAFQQFPDAIINGAANLAHPQFADWLLSTLIAFITNTGIGGFAWDHDIFAGDASLQQAQWSSWMYILSQLRELFPLLVMDHRQNSHVWGPWFVYAAPIFRCCMQLCRIRLPLISRQVSARRQLRGAYRRGRGPRDVRDQLSRAHCMSLCAGTVYPSPLFIPTMSQQTT
jgi:hypothetical protein